MFVLLTLLTGSLIFAQGVNKVIVDPDLKSDILIGRVNRDGLKSATFKSYFEEFYAKYTTDENILKQLKKKTGYLKILIVMGTWCDDSREQVPAFYKVLDEMKFSDSHVEIVAVNRKKTGGDVDVTGLNIERVPTFIFYRKEREIGRIVEKPSSTLEKSMLLILSQD